MPQDFPGTYALGVFVVSFLIGSIPWGVIVSRLFFGKDLRDEGSGNIGTTNALRSMGKAGGAAVFLLDFGKGLLAGGLAAHPLVPVATSESVHVLTAVAFLGCVWGHVFSPWLKFKGGKGVAVAVGCLFFTFGPLGAVVELAVFAVVVAATRYVSAGSIAAAAACPFLAFFFCYNSMALLMCALGACTVLWAHRGNMRRLRMGTERKVGS